MKQLLSLIGLSFLISSSLLSQEEVLYDFELDTYFWNNGSNTIPAGEPFKLNLIEIPNHNTIESIKVEIYASYDDPNENTGLITINDSKPIGTYDVKHIKDTMYTCNISTRLAVKRYYFFKVLIRTKTGDISKNPMKLYTSIKKTKLSSFGVYGGFGLAAFGTSEFKDFDINPLFVTGVKIHLRNRAKDDNIYRYIYGFPSRISIVVGTGINDLKYKSTEIESLLLGLKPAVGIDVELNKHLGLTAGGIFGIQESNSPFTERNKPVAGLWLSISLSADILKSFGAQSSSPQFSEKKQ